MQGVEQNTTKDDFKSNLGATTKNNFRLFKTNEVTIFLVHKMKSLEVYF